MLDDEKLAVTAIDLVAGTVTVKRGVLGAVPQKHNAGAMLYFCDEYLAIDSTDYYANESVNVKVLTNTSSAQLSQASATVHSITLKGEAYRPYHPANVKINGVFMPSYFDGDMQITWANRNRLQQTGGEIIGYFDGNIILEPGAQTLLTLTECDTSDAVIATWNVNVTAANSYTLLESQRQVDTSYVHIVLKTVRDGYECINAFDHIVRPSNLVAPANLAFEVIEI